MTAAMRRLAGVAVLMLVIFPLMMLSLIAIARHAAHWLRTGEDDVSILLDPASIWLLNLPERVGAWT